MKYLLVYAQPRPASYDPEKVIYELKEQLITAPTEVTIKRAVASFLAEGSISCGKDIMRRVVISLHPRTCVQPVLKPKQEFLSMDECF